jgi:SAM-dependent methyltransferase
MNRCLSCGRKRGLISLGYPLAEGKDTPDGAIAWTKLSLWGCRRCGYAWVKKAPSGRALDAYYRAEYSKTKAKRKSPPPPEVFFADERHQHRPARARRHVADLERVAGKEEFDAVLDVGAGFGITLSKIKAKRLLAIEPDEGARPYLEYIGADLLQGVDELSPRSVDALVCSHTLEHYRPASIHTMLRGMWQALRWDGVMVVEVPHASLLRLRGKHQHVPHLSFFSIEALARMLTRHGFRIVELYAAGPTPQGLVKSPLYKPKGWISILNVAAGLQPSFGSSGV